MLIFLYNLLISIGEIFMVGYILPVRNAPSSKNKSKTLQLALKTERKERSRGTVVCSYCSFTSAVQGSPDFLISRDAYRTNRR